jgi:hypothetical protein
MTKSDLIIYGNRTHEKLKNSNLSEEDKNYIEDYVQKLESAYEGTWDNIIPLINTMEKKKDEKEELNLFEKFVYEIGNVLLYKLSLGERGNLNFFNKERKEKPSDFIEDNWEDDWDYKKF